MASIDKRPDGRYRARWREYPGGPQRSKHFDRKIDAEQHLVKTQHDLLTGAYIDPNKARTTVKEFYSIWKVRQTVAAFVAHLDRVTVRQTCDSDIRESSPRVNPARRRRELGGKLDALAWDIRNRVAVFRHNARGRCCGRASNVERCARSEAPAG
jgi:hypothetical protein